MAPKNQEPSSRMRSAH